MKQAVLSSDVTPPAIVAIRREARLRGPQWQDGKARTMLRNDNWQGAAQNCLEVLQGDPEHLGALEVLAQAQWYGGQFDQVIQTTSRLLRLNPHEPGYRYTRGMAHISKGELLAALEDFREALRQSNNPEFQAQVSDTLEAVEAWSEEAMLNVSGKPTPRTFAMAPAMRNRSVLGARPGRFS